MRAEPSLMGSVPLMKRPQGALSPLRPCEDTEKTAILNQEVGPCQTLDLASALILNRPESRIVRNRCLLLMPPSLNQLRRFGFVCA